MLMVLRRFKSTRVTGLSWRSLKIQQAGHLHFSPRHPWSMFCFFLAPVLNEIVSRTLCIVTAVDRFKPMPPKSSSGGPSAWAAWALKQSLGFRI